MSENIIFKLDIDTRDLFKYYSGLEKTIYEGIPKFFVEEVDYNLQFNVPVITGALKRSLKFYSRPARPGNSSLGYLKLLWYGIPVEERRGFISRSLREAYAEENRIVSQAVAYGFGGRLG